MQTREIARIDRRGLRPIEPLPEFAHEIHAVLRRVEIERRALLGVRADDVEPFFDIDGIEAVCEQGDADESDQQQRVAEA
jgi:hypothetical protein